MEVIHRTIDGLIDRYTDVINELDRGWLRYINRHPIAFEMLKNDYERLVAHYRDEQAILLEYKQTADTESVEDCMKRNEQEGAKLDWHHHIIEQVSDRMVQIAKMKKRRFASNMDSIITGTIELFCGVMKEQWPGLDFFERDTEININRSSEVSPQGI